MKIQRVVSPGGIEAWLVEEHSIPLVAVRFGFTGGSTQDPVDKSGLASFLTAMLDEGAGDMNAAAFQEKLEDLAVKMSFSSSRDVFTGSFQSLSEHLDDAAGLLRLALNEPRFDDDAIERMRTQLLSSLESDAKNPDKIVVKSWFKIAFPDHPYAISPAGETESIRRIGRDDLEAYRKNVFARDTLKISVVGDIDAERLGRLIDKVFGSLPEKAQLREIADFEPMAGPVRQVISINQPQSVAQFGHRGIRRKDDDYIPAFILNYIIGGGGFSSRLMEEVRAKRGLAYSVNSGLYPMRYSSLYLGSVATKNEAIGKSLEVIRGVFSDMAENGPTEDELKSAKQYLTGSYALRFDTSSKIASQLLWIQLEDLGIDYIEKRNSLIDAVTISDLRRAAGRLLRPDNLITIIVGQPELGDDKS